MISVHKMENMEIGVWIIFYLITCLFALSSGDLAPRDERLERLCVNTALHT